MKLFLVGPTKRYDYDEYDAFVVRAESEDEARAIALSMAQGMPGPDVAIPPNCDGILGGARLRKSPRWPDAYTNPEFCPCVQIAEDGPKAIILGSYNRG
jgi:hypothetical protein